MQLYDSRRAPNPRRVRWLMAEKVITDIEIIDIDILTGAHRTPDYLSKVGIANVPALTLNDGTTITESVAICRYLEAVYPQPNLFGAGPEEAAVVEMWTRRAEMMVATNLMMAVRHSHPALAVLETQVPEIAAANRQTAERALKFFDRRLEDSEWIAADRVTMADGILYTALEFVRMIRFNVPEDLVSVLRWQEAMRSRPSAGAGG